MQGKDSKIAVLFYENVIFGINMERTLINQQYTGANGRKSLLDLVVPANFNQQLVVFMHGYMGYKDWGCWNLVQNQFVSKGYGFCKFNVSHNGGTVENPIDFPDLEAFAKNSYTNELSDLNAVLDWIETQFDTLPEIYLVGHSRGGGIVLLKANDPRVQRIVTWSAICDIEKRFPTGKQLEVWKTQGTRYTENSRTLQKMPHSYSQFDDFDANRDLLNIEHACLNSTKPTLVIHGDLDTSVEIEEGKLIATWLKTRLFEIEEANHTYGATQPWTEAEMPEHLQKVCMLTEGFFEIDYTN